MPEGIDLGDVPLMVKDCANREERLTPWERDYIQSLTEQLDNGRTLSEQQVHKLDEIWTRVT